MVCPRLSHLTFGFGACWWRRGEGLLSLARILQQLFFSLCLSPYHSLDLKKATLRSSLSRHPSRPSHCRSRTPPIHFRTDPHLLRCHNVSSNGFQAREDLRPSSRFRCAIPALNLQALLSTDPAPQDVLELLSWPSSTLYARLLAMMHSNRNPTHIWSRSTPSRSV
jgi:hypothetical protein